MKRLVAVVLASILLITNVAPVAANGRMERLVERLTTIQRNHGDWLHDKAHRRAKQIVRDFAHRNISRGTCEVLGWNRGFDDPVRAVIQAWINSPGHACILDRNYRRIGCAHIVRNYPRRETHYFVCILRDPR